MAALFCRPRLVRAVSGWMVTIHERLTRPLGFFFFFWYCIIFTQLAWHDDAKKLKKALIWGWLYTDGDYGDYGAYRGA